MLCWYFRPTLRVMFWWAYFTSNIVVSGCHIKIILLTNAAYIRSSLVAYIATQHAQHAVRRQFRYPTSPPTLGVSKVNSSKWLNCSSQSHFLVAFWSRVICGWFSVNMPRNSIEKQAHFFTGTNNATPTLFSNLFMGTRVPNPATWMCSSYFSLGSSLSLHRTISVSSQLIHESIAPSRCPRMN